MITLEKHVIIKYQNTYNVKFLYNPLKKGGKNNDKKISYLIFLKYNLIKHLNQLILIKKKDNIWNLSLKKWQVSTQHFNVINLTKFG